MRGHAKSGPITKPFSLNRVGRNRTVPTEDCPGWGVSLTVPARHRERNHTARASGTAGGILSAAIPAADLIQTSGHTLAQLAFSDWFVIAGFAISGVAIALVGYNLLRSRRGRLAKGFLLDSQGNLLKQIVFDTGCPVSLDEVRTKLPARGLSGDAEAELSGYRIKPIHSEKLHLIMVFRGRSAPDHADYATFLMAGAGERVEGTPPDRATALADPETAAAPPEAHLPEEEKGGAPPGPQVESPPT